MIMLSQLCFLRDMSSSGVKGTCQKDVALVSKELMLEHMKDSNGHAVAAVPF